MHRQAQSLLGSDHVLSATPRSIGFQTQVSVLPLEHFAALAITPDLWQIPASGTVASSCLGLKELLAHRQRRPDESTYSGGLRCLHSMRGSASPGGTPSRDPFGELDPAQCRSRGHGCTPAVELLAVLGRIRAELEGTIVFRA